MGVFGSKLGNIDTVLPFAVKVYMVYIIRFYCKESDSPAHWAKIILN